jgi:transcription elongation GreA/GreB family factor
MEMEKFAVWHACEKLLLERLELLKYSLQQLEESMQSESKRSSGDKHETGRAKMQAEQETLHTQVLFVRQQLHLLYKIDKLTKLDSAKPGALIKTSKGYFYVALGLGKLHVGNIPVFAVSPESPIGNKLMSVKAGDSFTFNDIHYSVEFIG